MGLKSGGFFMKFRCWLYAYGVLLLAALPVQGADKSSSYRITLTATDCDYRNLPVFVPVRLSSAPGQVRLFEVSTRGSLPAQLIREGATTRIVWIERELKKGETRQYRLEFRPSVPVSQSVRVRRLEEGAEVSIGNQLFTRYVTEKTPRPFCYPIIGPTGKAMTRNYPMLKVEGESTDHIHHRSFWFTFGEVNGYDFWAEEGKTGRIVHRDFEILEGGPVMGRIRAKSDWIAPDGKKVCEDTRELRIYNTPEGRLMDFEVALRASEGPVTFGDTKEGMMAFRVASSMEVTRGQGHIENAAGDRDAKAWGKRAVWCDYWGPVEGDTLGIAILDDPGNLRHPTWWHVRDYGLFAANPFGMKAFGEKEDGRYILPAGKTLTFRYRIYLHQGTTTQARIADIWEQYIHPPVANLASR